AALSQPNERPETKHDSSGDGRTQDQLTSLLCVDGPLGDILARAAAGTPPSADGGLTVLAQPSERDAGVIAFTGHNVVFADVAPGWVRGQLPAGDPAAPLGARFLHALGEQLGRQAGTTDMLTVAAALPGP